MTRWCSTLDGVLSDAAGRQHLLDRPWRDWDAFFDACGEDPLIDEVATLLHHLDSRVHVVLLTARPIRVQRQTLSWLERNDLRWDLLIMRDYGDYESARDFKGADRVGPTSQRPNPTLAFEDDRRNVEMFHDEGVPCVYIHSGYFG